MDQDLGARAEVRRHTQDVVGKLRFDRLAHQKIGRKISPTEAINRLLWIADQEKATRYQPLLVPILWLLFAASRNMISAWIGSVS